MGIAPAKAVAGTLPPPPKKKLSVTDWFNIVGVIVGIVSAVPVVFAAIRVANTLSSSYELLVDGKLLKQIHDAEREAVANVQKAGLVADSYHFAFSNNTVVGGNGSPAPTGSLDAMANTISGTLKNDGDVGCRSVDAQQVICVRRGDYTRNGERQIVGATIGRTDGSGFSNVIAYVALADAKQLMLWLFRPDANWAIKPNSAGGSFEFHTDVLVFTKPASEKLAVP